ncbi:MAG TPA: hypothetical protein VGH00_09900, partial [Chthoniobacterales bacterium]
MMQLEGTFPVPLPDDPYKWDGWSKYKSPNLYERLCLDPRANPSNELIEQHCRELMRWWQKKLPLKNQPSNPLAQILRPGLDESSRYLTQARVELLDPERRRQVDSELAAQANEQAVIEFHKYLTFALADGVLTAEEEKSLYRFGAEHGLTAEQVTGYVEAELKDSGAQRVAAVAPEVAPPREARPRRQKSLDPKEDFLRMLRLSGLDTFGMADDTRDAFVNMAENLGIDAADAEELIDIYLEEADKESDTEGPELPRAPVLRAPPPKAAARAPVNGHHASAVAAPAPLPIVDADRQRFANYV